MQLKHTHCLVTGGARRIGRAITQALLEQGARVTVHTHHSSFVAPSEFATAALNVHADLQSPDEIHTCVKEAESRFGPVRVLVNNASIFKKTPTEAVTTAQWDELLGTNLRGQFFFAQAVFAGMRAAAGGCILNLCDISAHTPFRGFTPYVVSKAGLWMLTRNLAKEWAPEIRVNSISPGAVLPPDAYTQDEKKRAIQHCPLGRWGSAQDIVNAALFLISNDYITGADLKVDGGRSLANA